MYKQLRLAFISEFSATWIMKQHLVAKIVVHIIVHGEGRSVEMLHTFDY